MCHNNPRAQAIIELAFERCFLGSVRKSPRYLTSRENAPGRRDGEKTAPSEAECSDSDGEESLLIEDIDELPEHGEEPVIRCSNAYAGNEKFGEITTTVANSVHLKIDSGQDRPRFQTIMTKPNRCTLKPDPKKTQVRKQSSYFDKNKPSLSKTRLKQNLPNLVTRAKQKIKNASLTLISRSKFIQSDQLSKSGATQMPIAQFIPRCSAQLSSSSNAHSTPKCSAQSPSTCNSHSPRCNQNATPKCSAQFPSKYNTQSPLSSDAQAKPKCSVQSHFICNAQSLSISNGHTIPNQDAHSPTKLNENSTLRCNANSTSKCNAQTTSKCNSQTTSKCNAQSTSKPLEHSIPKHSTHSPHRSNTNSIPKASAQFLPKYKTQSAPKSSTQCLSRSFAHTHPKHGAPSPQLCIEQYSQRCKTTFPPKPISEIIPKLNIKPCQKSTPSDTQFIKSDTSPNQITYDHSSLSDYNSNTESNLQPQHDQSLDKQLIPKISTQFSPKLHTHANVTSNTHTDKITPRSTGNVKPYALCVKPFHTKPRPNTFASLEGRRKEVIEGRGCPWTKEAKSIFLQVGIDIVDRIITEDLGLEIKEISLEIDEGKPQTDRSDESDLKEDSRSQKGESETEGKESHRDSDKKQWRKSSADVSKIFSQQPPKYQMGVENMRSLKDVVDKVVKEHKTFCVEGSYGAIRNAMKKRGWLEKREPRWTPKRSNHNGNRQTKNTSPDPTVISRLLRNIQVDFLWTMRADACEWMDFKRKQLVNRFPRTGFNTKIGLCASLQQMHWFNEAGVSHTLFPRSYNICNTDEWLAFQDDFRMTACLSLLRWMVIMYEEGNAKAIQSLKGKVPVAAVDFAVKRCNEYISVQNHEDIDKENFVQVWDYQWDQFITWYYLIVHSNELLVETKDPSAQMLYNLALLTLGKMKKYWPQMHLDGLLNIWIVKPGASSRGRGIVLMDRMEKIMAKVNPSKAKETRYIVQKYMERPLLIHNTKFDIRQWFLVTCVQPLTIWMYKESYLRFCSQSFDLRNFHESVHLCNHAVQCKYKNGKRDKNLPDENMWDCYTFQTYLRVQGKAEMWDKRIYPGMRQSIIGALLAAQETMDRRKNCFELFGADFMLDEHLTPWLIEINSCPAMCESTSVTARMCSQCLEDVIKVVIDRRQNKKAETGMFEMVFRQRIPPAPAYLGMTLAVRGEKIYKTSIAKPANGMFRTNFMKQLREEDLEQIRIEPTPCRATAEFPSKSPLPDIAETKPAKRVSTEDKGKYAEPDIFLDEDTVPVEIVKPIIQGLIENLKYKDDPNRFGETYDDSPVDTVQASFLNLFDGMKYNKDNIFHTRDYGRNGKESLFEIEASIVASNSDSESDNQNPNEDINCSEEGELVERNATRTSDHGSETDTKTLEAITKEGNTQNFDTELNRDTVLTKDTQPIIQCQLENTSFKTNNLENESPENNTNSKNDETSKYETSDESKSPEENKTEKQTESPKNIFEKQQNETNNKKISAITILSQHNENFKKSSTNDPTKLIRKPKPNYIHKLENAKDLYKFITEKQNEIDSYDKQIECFQNMVEKKQSLTEQNEGKKFKINTKTIKLTNNKRTRSNSPAFLPSKPNKDDETRSTKPQNEENKRKLKRFYKKNGNNSEKRQNMKKQHKQIEAAKKQMSLRSNDEKSPLSLTFDPHRDSNNTIKHEMKINTFKNKDIKKPVMQEQNNKDQEIRPSFDHLGEPTVIRESYDELINNDSKTNQKTIFSQEVFADKHKTIESDCDTNKTSKPSELYKGDSNNPKYYSNHNLTSKELDGKSQTNPIETNIRGKVWLNPIDDQPKQLSSEETTPKRKKLKSNTWRNSDDAVRAIEFYDEWKKKLAQTRASCEELLYKLRVFKENDGLATKPKCSLDKNVIWDGEICNKPTLSDMIKKLSQTQSGIEVCPSSSAKSLVESLSDSQTKNKMWERRTSYLNMAEEDIQTKSKHTNEKVGSTGQKIRVMPQLAINDKTIPPSKLMLPHIKNKSKTQLNNNIIDTQSSVSNFFAVGMSLRNLQTEFSQKEQLLLPLGSSHCNITNQNVSQPV